KGVFKNAYMNYLKFFRPLRVLLLFCIFLFLIPILGKAQLPSCENFSLGINEQGKSEFTLKELLKNNQEFPVSLTIRAESKALIFQGEINDPDEIIELELCQYVDDDMEYRLRNSAGSCEGKMIVSMPPVPYMKGRKIKVFAGDPLIEPGQLIGDTFPTVHIPCALPGLKVKDDNIVSSECQKYEDPVKQVIFRHLEGEDLWGRSFSTEDTIVVYKFPEIKEKNFTNQSMYYLQCGASENFGPELIY